MSSRLFLFGPIPGIYSRLPRAIPARLHAYYYSPSSSIARCPALQRSGPIHLPYPFPLQRRCSSRSWPPPHMHMHTPHAQITAPTPTQPSALCRCAFSLLLLLPEDPLLLVHPWRDFSPAVAVYPLPPNLCTRPAAHDGKHHITLAPRPPWCFGTIVSQSIPLSPQPPSQYSRYQHRRRPPLAYRPAPAWRTYTGLAWPDPGPSSCCCPPNNRACCHCRWCSRSTPTTIQSSPLLRFPALSSCPCGALPHLRN